MLDDYEDEREQFLGVGAAHGVSDKKTKGKKQPIGFVVFPDPKPDPRRKVRRQRTKARRRK